MLKIQSVDSKTQEIYMASTDDQKHNQTNQDNHMHDISLICNINLLELSDLKLQRQLLKLNKQTNQQFGYSIQDLQDTWNEQKNQSQIQNFSQIQNQQNNIADNQLNVQQYEIIRKISINSSQDEPLQPLKQTIYPTQQESLTHIQLIENPLESTQNSNQEQQNQQFRSNFDNKNISIINQNSFQQSYYDTIDYEHNHQEISYENFVENIMNVDKSEKKFNKQQSDQLKKSQTSNNNKNLIILEDNPLQKYQPQQPISQKFQNDDIILDEIEYPIMEQTKKNQSKSTMRSRVQLKEFKSTRYYSKSPNIIKKSNCAVSQKNYSNIINDQQIIQDNYLVEKSDSFQTTDNVNEYKGTNDNHDQISIFQKEMNIKLDKEQRNQQLNAYKKQDLKLNNFIHQQSQEKKNHQRKNQKDLKETKYIKSMDKSNEKEFKYSSDQLELNELQCILDQNDQKHGNDAQEQKQKYDNDQKKIKLQINQQKEENEKIQQKQKFVQKKEKEQKQKVEQNDQTEQKEKYEFNEQNAKYVQHVQNQLKEVQLNQKKEKYVQNDKSKQSKLNLQKDRKQILDVKLQNDIIDKQDLKFIHPKEKKEQKIQNEQKSKLDQNNLKDRKFKEDKKDRKFKEDKKGRSLKEDLQHKDDQKNQQSQQKNQKVQIDQILIDNQISQQQSQNNQIINRKQEYKQRVLSPDRKYAQTKIIDQPIQLSNKTYNRNFYQLNRQKNQNDDQLLSNLMLSKQNIDSNINNNILLIQQKLNNKYQSNKKQLDKIQVVDEYAKQSAKQSNDIFLDTDVSYITNKMENLLSININKLNEGDDIKQLLENIDLNSLQDESSNRSIPNVDNDDEQLIGQNIDENKNRYKQDNQDIGKLLEVKSSAQNKTPKTDRQLVSNKSPSKKQKNGIKSDFFHQIYLKVALKGKI